MGSLSLILPLPLFISTPRSLSLPLLSDRQTYIQTYRQTDRQTHDTKNTHTLSLFASFSFSVFLCHFPPIGFSLLDLLSFFFSVAIHKSLPLST